MKNKVENLIERIEEEDGDFVERVSETKYIRIQTEGDTFFLTAVCTRCNEQVADGVSWPAWLGDISDGAHYCFERGEEEYLLEAYELMKEG